MFPPKKYIRIIRDLVEINYDVEFFIDKSKDMGDFVGNLDGIEFRISHENSEIQTRRDESAGGIS